MQNEAEFLQIAQLIEQLKSEEVALRVNATRALPAIAATLGPERTRSELLPFLGECTDDDDEVLLALAEQLGRLSDAVGGVQYLNLLLVPLEALAATDEAAVRDAAVLAMQAVISQMSSAQLSEHCVPLAQRLTASIHYTARVSACGLFAPIYARLPAERAQQQPPAAGAAGGGDRALLLSCFSKLCGDEAAMVKRVAAASLGSLVRAAAAAPAPAPGVLEALLTLFDRLAADDQDSVRVQTVDNCIALAQVLPAEGQSTRILPAVKRAAEDESWRVRWSIANKFHDLGAAFKAVGDGRLAPPLCESYERLLQDQEAEVRTAAAFSVTKVGQLMDVNGVLTRIIPCLQQLVIDGCEHVRAALASVICELAPLLGQEMTIHHLLPLLLTLLRDTNSDVRLNIISKLHSINSVIGVDLLAQSLLPAILGLAEDSKWRVRLAIIEHMPLLAGQLGAAFFSEQLCSLCLGWLGDDVFSVRVAAAANLRRLSDLLGGDWTRAHVLPKLSDMHSHASYLHRMTALFAVQLLGESMDSELLHSDVLPLVLSMAADPVPNIRFNVSKTLATIAPRLGGGAVEGQIRPALNALVDDPDRDVRFYTRQAIAALG